MATETIVMYESDEAATRKTVTGWVSREGQFWGDNEHMARYCGSTHQLCECGNVFAGGHTKCSSCEAKQQTETYYALPMVEWDGETPIVLHDSEQYFFDEGAFLDHLADLKHNEPDVEHEVQPVLCEPMHLHLLSAEDWCDDLPENGDGELPSAVAAKLEELNEAIRKATPVAWTEGKVRINMASLWARLAVPAG